MCTKPIEYEYTLADGSKRYEIVYDRKEAFAFQKMHEKESGGPVSFRPLGKEGVA